MRSHFQLNQVLRQIPQIEYIQTGFQGSPPTFEASRKPQIDRLIVLCPNTSTGARVARPPLIRVDGSGAPLSERTTPVTVEVAYCAIAEREQASRTKRMPARRCTFKSTSVEKRHSRQNYRSKKREVS